MAIQIKTAIPLNPLSDQPPVTAHKPRKPKASKPVQPAQATGKRGRPASADPRSMVGIRLPASLIADLDVVAPDWKAAIEPLLRRHFGL